MGRDSCASGEPMTAELQIEALAFLIEKKIVSYDPATDTYRLVREPTVRERRSLAKELANRGAAA